MMVPTMKPTTKMRSPRYPVCRGAPFFCIIILVTTYLGVDILGACHYASGKSPHFTGKPSFSCRCTLSRIPSSSHNTMNVNRMVVFVTEVFHLKSLSEHWNFQTERLERLVELCQLLSWNIPSLTIANLCQWFLHVSTCFYTFLHVSTALYWDAFQIHSISLMRFSLERHPVGLALTNPTFRLSPISSFRHSSIIWLHQVETLSWKSWHHQIPKQQEALTFGRHKIAWELYRTCTFCGFSKTANEAGNDENIASRFPPCCMTRRPRSWWWP